MKIKKTTPAMCDPDMTPMIDIVFQLIAFFMIVTNFEQTQADERVKLPADELAKPPDVPREDELVINIGFDRDRNGNLIDETPWVFKAGEKVRVLDFQPHLEQEWKLAKYKKEEPEKFTIVIRADAETPTGLVQEIIKFGQEVGFSKFAVKAMSDESEEGG